MVPALTFLSSIGDDPTLWAIAGAIGGVYLFYRGFRTLQRKRLILNTPTSKVRSASMGLVELSGLAVGPYTIAAPITGRACYYYRTIAWQLKQSGKSKEWQKVAEESLHVPFYLDDNTGRVLVNPQGAELDIHRDFHQEFGGSFFAGSPDVPANVAGFLARHGVSNDRKLKIDEYCIKPKNALFVLGTLAENPGFTASSTPVRSVAGDRRKFSFRIGTGGLLDGAFGSTNTATPRTFSFSTKNDFYTGPAVAAENKSSGAGPSQQARIAAALNKAGITNPAAWAAAGLQYPGVAVSTEGAGAAPAQAFDPHPPVVLMKGARNPVFFISWRSQKEIVQSLGWKSAAMIWSGPALTLLSAYVLAARFGWL